MAKKRNMLIKRDDTIFDNILAYYVNPEAVVLSPTQEDILDRLNEIIRLRQKHFTPKMIVNKFKNERGISQAQTYIDIKRAENLFGSVSKADAEAARAMWVHHAQDFLRRARKKKDFAAEAKALKMLAEYSGWSKDENPSFNPDKLINPTIEFKIPKKYLPFLKQMANQGVDDFNLETHIDDIDFEEIKDDE